SVGQAPVTTLDLQNPEVSIVLNTLREINRQVQSEGWIFNTERDYVMQPDSNTNEITYPYNVLQMDANVEHHKNDYDLVRRNGKLYDRLHHTFEFTEDIHADITWYFDFTDVPPAVQTYITARAARMCATKLIGDQEINKLLAEQEVYTRAAAIEYECNQGDYSMFGFRDGHNYYASYQPYQALMR
ncbi:MAG: hypothetical protein ACO3YX_06750, partial [Candidatus Nanopelagicaceae bacterium]